MDDVILMLSQVTGPLHALDLAPPEEGVVLPSRLLPMFVTLLEWKAMVDSPRPTIPASQSLPRS